MVVALETLKIGSVAVPVFTNGAFTVTVSTPVLKAEIVILPVAALREMLEPAVNESTPALEIS